MRTVNIRFRTKTNENVTIARNTDWIRSRLEEVFAVVDDLTVYETKSSLKEEDEQIHQTGSSNNRPKTV